MHKISEVNILMTCCRGLFELLSWIVLPTAMGFLLLGNLVMLIPQLSFWLVGHTPDTFALGIFLFLWVFLLMGPSHARTASIFSG